MSASPIRAEGSAFAAQARDRSGLDPDSRSGAQRLVSLTEELLSRPGKASSVAVARAILEQFEESDEGSKVTYFEALVDRFGADHKRLTEAAHQYLDDPSNAHAVALHDAAEPRRQELTRRLNRAPGGTAALVDMRRQLIEQLENCPDLVDADHDFYHLLSSWFDLGFLALERIHWSTPGTILEKIIQYEAVHEILTWDDLRRRIEPSDRRCYGFFHPNLADEPLIFVSVALTQGIPTAIHPLLSEEHSPISSAAADTAVFYSISNCQQGLLGVSFGDFLIKQVVEELALDLPGLRTFVTLSPVPGFKRWLSTVIAEGSNSLIRAEHRETLKLLDKSDWHSTPETAAALEELIVPLAAFYFLRARREDNTPVDAVARFHLANGARLERINWLGDVSAASLSNAAGLMVNYLYDLRYIERNHAAFVGRGEVVASTAIRERLGELSKNCRPRNVCNPDAGDSLSVPGKE